MPACLESLKAIPRGIPPAAFLLTHDVARRTIEAETEAANAPAKRPAAAPLPGSAENSWSERFLGGVARVLRMTGAVYDAIRAHGEETYPDECCGALIGNVTPDGWRVTEARRAGNARTDSAHNRYSIAPLELVRIEREARGMGAEIAGFYHSHPDHPAQWSSTDFAEAHWLGCSYLITQIVVGKATVSNSFLLLGSTEEEKQFLPERISIED